MAGAAQTWTEIEHLLRRATHELERAARAGAVAARHERLTRTAQPGSQARDLHEKMGQIHRQLGRRHLTSARIHRAHAERLRECLGSGATGSIPPAFMAALAETSGADSALLSLFGHRHAEALVLTSDKIAAAAHDLEATLAEGPGRDAVAGHRLVAASDGALERRWPMYGPAAARLGIYAAAAVPLAVVPDRCLGTLTVFGLHPSEHLGTESLGSVADALMHTMLLSDERAYGEMVPGDDNEVRYGGAGGTAAAGAVQLPVRGDDDLLAVVHQAAGLVAGECGCDIADALAIIRARAFAESEPVEEVAAKVVSRDLRLCPDLNFPAPPGSER